MGAGVDSHHPLQISEGGVRKQAAFLVGAAKTAVVSSMQTKPSSPVWLGWREHVALPGLGIARLRAKIDTGARSSALHVDEQWRFVEGGEPWVGFRLTPRRGKPAHQEARARIHDERQVADSSGRRTQRIFIRTLLHLGGVERMVEINLTDRCGMLFPMLVGRTALQDAFTVDPSGSFLHRRHRGRAGVP